jgi:rhomboid protease GluP
MPDWLPQPQSSTFIILTANLGLFAALMLLSTRGPFSGIDSITLQLFGASSPVRIFGAGEYWRLITAGFLHGGLLHIAMNSWSLWDLGAQAEEEYGASRFITIYIASTIAGFGLSALWGNLSVGASAGLFGLIGAMIAAGIRANSMAGEEMKQIYIRWAVYGLIMGLMFSSYIDHAAHVGGLFGGMAVGYAAGHPLAESDPREKFWRLTGALTLVLTGAAFLSWVLWYAKITART